jgi:hypothetical protein
VTVGTVTLEDLTFDGEALLLVRQPDGRRRVAALGCKRLEVAGTPLAVPVDFVSTAEDPLEGFEPIQIRGIVFQPVKYVVHVNLEAEDV